MLRNLILLIAYCQNLTLSQWSSWITVLAAHNIYYFFQRSKSILRHSSDLGYTRGGSLMEILNYLPDGGHFSRVPMWFQIQGKSQFQVHVRHIYCKLDKLYTFCESYIWIHYIYSRYISLLDVPDLKTV